MKSKLGLLAMTAALMGGGFGNLPHSSKREDGEIDFTPKIPPKPNGLKKFIIDGKEVWALNEKNAIRKSKKV